MKSASKLIKLAGFKSTKYVSELTGISTDSIERATPERFKEIIETAQAYESKRIASRAGNDLIELDKSVKLMIKELENA